MLTFKAIGRRVPAPELVIDGARITGYQLATLGTSLAKYLVETLETERLICVVTMTRWGADVVINLVFS